MNAYGEAAPTEQLNPRAASVARALERLGQRLFAKLIETRHDATEGCSTIVFEVEPEVPSRPVVPIQEKERLAARFFDSDSAHPQVIALRDDFPTNVLHRNITPDLRPVHLCLTDQKWEEMRGTWSPAWFIERIRWWLSQTAKGTLHRDDQVMEGFLLTSGKSLIVPRDFDPKAKYQIMLPNRTSLEETSAFFLVPIGKPQERMASVEHVVMVATTKPVAHGPIEQLPTTTRALCELISEKTGDDLRAMMAAFIFNLPKQERARKFILILEVPQKRSPADPGTESRYYAFHWGSSIEDLGHDIHTWLNREHAAHLLLPPTLPPKWGATPISVLSIIRTFNQDSASIFSGEKPFPEATFIGAGALGSQVITYLARSGSGAMTIVDDDTLMPHNLQRHALTDYHVGRNKAFALADELTGTTQIEAKGLRLNVLTGNAAEVEDLVRTSQYIIDLSASSAVASMLINQRGAGSARLGCSFLSPTGQDLIVMMESIDRAVGMTDLECHYLRSLAISPALADHMPKSRPTGIRYGRGCSDRSIIIPGELVAIHAATAARILRRAAEQTAATFAIMRASEQGETIALEKGPLTPADRQTRGGWQVSIHQDLLKDCQAARERCLPNETGGVLLGRWDRDLRTIQIVAMIEAPVDSQQEKAVFVRGKRGLKKAVEEMGIRTGQQIGYVGEWHSHPRGSSTGASITDVVALAQLAETLASDSIPAIQMIFGDGNDYSLNAGLLVEGGQGDD